MRCCTGKIEDRNTCEIMQAEGENMRPYVDEDTCIGCGTCLAVCPIRPHIFDVNDVSHVVHPELCEQIGECVEHCPVDAITLDD